MINRIKYSLNRRKMNKLLMSMQKTFKGDQHALIATFPHECTSALVKMIIKLDDAMEIIKFSINPDTTLSEIKQLIADQLGTEFLERALIRPLPPARSLDKRLEVETKKVAVEHQLNLNF